MTHEARRDIRLLLKEAQRYLAAVDAFRAEGCEPDWRLEREPDAVVGPRPRRLALGMPPIP